ncbi:MAG: hypothetical protein LBV20_07270 [Treponema sp.]|jgi:hypothetical protein|nr:hypothetical protein [Treponema sp.]
MSFLATTNFLGIVKMRLVLSYVWRIYITKTKLWRKLFYGSLSILNFTTFCITLYKLILQQFAFGNITDIITVATFVITLLLLRQRLISVRKKLYSNEYYIKPKSQQSIKLSELEPNPCDETDGYTNYNNEGKAFISSKINERINQSIIKVEIDKKRIKDIRKKILMDDPYSLRLKTAFNNAIRDKTELFNESKLCLSSEIDFNEKRVYCHKGTYFDSIETNDMFGKELTVNLDDNTTFVTSLKEIYHYHEDKQLLPIQCTFMNCHLGASVLAITKDNKLVVMLQTKRSFADSEKLVPTGNGSSDWKDLKKYSNLLDVVRQTMKRELLEETHLNYNYKVKRSIKLEDIIVLGFFKWIEKGPKPQFVGIVRLKDVDSAMIKETKEGKKHMLYPAGSKEELEKSIATIFDQAKDPDKPELSVALEMNLICIQAKLDAICGLFFPNL